jgi:uncharacterized membrane protein YccF (DUF307 family)
MNVIGNLLWIILGGFLLSLFWAVAGLLCCITVIGIPMGIQCFKIAGFVLTPFGKNIILGNFGVFGFIANLLWIFLLGWELAITSLSLGLVCCLTIVGIPFGIQYFKFAQLAFLPFGARVV